MDIPVDWNTANQLMSWLAGSITISGIITAVLVLLFLWGVLKVARPILVLGMLFIVCWVPVVIVTLAVDTSTVPTMFPLKGVGTLMFVYAWDVYLGAFQNTAFAYVPMVMMGLSYFTMFEIAWTVAKWRKRGWLMTPLYAYLFTLGLGLGIPNTNGLIFGGYSAWSISLGLNPLIIPVVISVLFFSFIALILMTSSKSSKGKKLNTTS